MKQVLFFLMISLMMFISSCSLLEFTMSTEGVPLTKEELSKRFAVRTFSSDFIARVSQVADSVAAQSEQVEGRKNAIKWKLSVANTISPIAFQSKGDLAIIETWLFCEQMQDFFETTTLDSLFEKKDVQAIRECALGGTEQMQKIAKRLLSAEGYAASVQLIEIKRKQNPFTSLDFTAQGVSALYQEFLQIPDSMMVSGVGTVPELISDLTDRMGMYGKQVQRNVEWKSDIIGMSWETDSMAQQFLQKTDTLTALLNAIAEIARDSPELANQIAANMNEQLRPIISDASVLMHQSMQEFDHQRDSIQRFLNVQREAIQRDIVVSGDSLMHSAADSLACFVRKISFAIVLVVILLIVLLFGLPFFLGYFIAKLQYRSKNRTSAQGEMNNRKEEL
ncbi:MAG: hypothetical protein ACK5IJ_08655 [Mangrovibacterium sp.]